MFPGKGSCSAGGQAPAQRAQTKLPSEQRAGLGRGEDGGRQGWCFVACGSLQCPNFIHLQSHVRPEMAGGRRGSGEGFLEDRETEGAAEVKRWVFHPLESGAVGACGRVES